MQSKMNVYCCGGTGVNIGSLLEAGLKADNSGIANITPIYLDTSDSNLGLSHPESRTYIIPGLPRPGSGKVRAENYERIVACVPQVLSKFKPADINIVVSSTGGGSGSVIAPSLLSALLDEDQLVIALAVGSTDSVIEVKNTIKTLQSYENMAVTREKPVPAVYWQNTPDQKRAAVNQKLKEEIVRLAVLFSGMNVGLDASDLRNWLRYNRPNVTGYPAHLVSLEVFADRIAPKNSNHVISVATLTSDVDKVATGLTVDYQATGFVDKSFEALNLSNTLHFALVDGYFAEVQKNLQAIVDESEVSKTASTGRKAVVVDASKATGNGMVL